MRMILTLRFSETQGNTRAAKSFTTKNPEFKPISVIADTQSTDSSVPGEFTMLFRYPRMNAKTPNP